MADHLDSPDGLRWWCRILRQCVITSVGVVTWGAFEWAVYNGLLWFNAPWPVWAANTVQTICTGFIVCTAAVFAAADEIILILESSLSGDAEQQPQSADVLEPETKPAT
jgi:hypothetical protein